MNVHRIFGTCLLGTLVFLPVTASAGGDGAASRILSVSENAGPGTLVGEVDPDARDRKGRYEIVSGNLEGAFSIDSDTGRLTVENPAALDYERRERFDLTLHVTRPAPDHPSRRAFLNDLIESGASLESVVGLLTDIGTLRVSIMVEDVAERPVLPMQFTTVIAYGNEVVDDTWIDAHDQDRGDALTFEIVGGAPEGLFEIESGSGRLSINSTATLPPGDHRFPLTVRVTDSSGYSDATTIPVRVVALAGAPESLVVAAPEPLPDTAGVLPPATDPGAEFVDAGGDSAAVASEQAAESIARGPLPVADKAGQPLVSGTTPESGAGAGPATESMGRQLARVAGMFLLLGAFVALVLWWLKWRTRQEPLDAFEDERLRRLQLMTEERCVTQPAAGDIEPAMQSIDVEDAVVQQLSGLQQLLTEHSQVEHGTDAHQEPVGEPDPAGVEESPHDSHAVSSHVSESLDATRPMELRTDTSEPQRDDARDELYDVAEDDSYEVAFDEVETAVETSREFEDVESTLNDGDLFDDSQPDRAEEDVPSPVNQDPAESSGFGTETYDILRDEQGVAQFGEYQAETATHAGEGSDANAGWTAADGTIPPVDDDSQRQPVAADAQSAWPVDQDPDEYSGFGTETYDVLRDEQGVAQFGEYQAETGADAGEESDANEGWPAADRTPPLVDDDSQRRPVAADAQLTWPVDQDPAEFAESGTETYIPRDEQGIAQFGEDQVETGTDASDERDVSEGLPLADGSPVNDDSQPHTVAADTQWMWEMEQAPVEPEAETREITWDEPDSESTGLELAGAEQDSRDASAENNSTLIGGLLESIRNELRNHTAASTEHHATSRTPDSDEPDAVQMESTQCTLVEGEGAQLDPVREVTDSTEDAVDPRVRHLRDELADKFGVGVRESSGDAESTSPDPAWTSAAESGFASVGAESTPDAEGGVAAVVDSPSLGTAALQETPDDPGWGGGLSTARFLLSPPADASPVEPEPAAEPDEAAPEVRPAPVKRRNKSEIRRQMSSLREVAILHARARMAQEAPRERTRQTWYISASAMVVLNFAAMGLLASAPGGLLKVIGWGLMMAGAGALAVCLHSFHQMAVNDGVQEGEDDAAGPDSADADPQGGII